MKVPEAYKFKADLLKFAQKTKSRFAEVIENENKTKIAKTQFALDINFLMTRNGERQVEYYFKQRDPAVLNRNNVATVNNVFR